MTDWIDTAVCFIAAAYLVVLVFQLTWEDK
jgi:hypothetical protein